MDGTLSNVKILPVKVLSAKNTGTDTDICLGVRYAIDKGVDVINLSLGGYGECVPLDEMIEEATAKGIIVCVAAGNDSVDAIDVHPANAEPAITVGAIDNTFSRATFSNYGEVLDISAPGVDSPDPHGNRISAI